MARVLSRIALAALTACGSSAAQLPPDAVPDPDAGAADPELAVLSLNLHCLQVTGTPYATNTARFAAIAAAVADERVDVVLAQEVCANPSEDARAMLITALEAATGATWSAADAFAHRAWEGTPDEADEYVAIFARATPREPRVIEHRTQASLRRISLGATITSALATAAGDPIRVRVFTAHLDHADAVARAAQARELAAAAMVDADDPALALTLATGEVALPVIVGGDFNAHYADPAPQAAVALGFVEASASAATTRIDHVFAHRSAPLAVAATTELFVGAAAVSDHPGVLVRFVAAPPAGVRLTRIVATGNAAPLTVRGDAGPLSWTAGWPAIARADGAAFVTSEVPGGAFAYKFLRDDVDWQLGPNSLGTGEADNVSQPTF